MKRIESEDDFHRWTMDTLGRVGHAQSHRFSHEPDIPDISCAAGGTDMWLELKYGRFSMAAGPEGRDYDRFEFKEVTRGQLAWLTRRAECGASICGILGYLDVLPSRTTPYLFFMSASAYFERHMRREKARHTIGSVILSRFTVPFDRVRDEPEALLGFLGTAGYLSELPEDHPDLNIVGKG